MWTLDHAAKECQGNILIKIDTQGFERQVSKEQKNGRKIEGRADGSAYHRSLR